MFIPAALTLLAGCAADFLAPAAPRPAGPPVPTAFALGPVIFRDGDSIRIDEVEASSPDFKAGDRLIVRGWYDLHSCDSAELRLYLTSYYAPPYRLLVPAPRMTIRRGVGPFRFEWAIPGAGALHVSFYPSEGGVSLGDLYFGSDTQMDWVSGLQSGETAQMDARGR
ncbi:MAG TPA: hypothetical protein VMD31_01445 [Opitutaceae bacterium]|nr:hypothetical protein [Opitutaceae bacterium]